MAAPAGVAPTAVHPGSPRVLRRWRRATALAAVGVVLGSAGAHAGHQFSDVPSGHAFHSEISAVAGAGITTGFPDGTFRPANDVTRQAMAAFFHRGASRASAGTGTVSAGAGKTVVVARATLTAGGTPPGNGFARLVGDAYAFASGGNVGYCLCVVRLQVVDQRGDALGEPALLSIPARGDEAGVAAGHATVQAVVPLPRELSPSSTATFRLLATVEDSDATGISVSGNLAATYVPFSGDGDAALGHAVSCPGDDGFEPNDSEGTATRYHLDGNATFDDTHQGFPGELVHGALCSTARPDWYALSRNLAAGERLRVFASFKHAEGDIDLCLFRSRVQIGCAESTTDDEVIDHTAPSAGAYAVLVRLDDDPLAPGTPYRLQLFHR